MNIVVLRRRLFYICAMVALLVPIHFLGKTSVRNQDGSVNIQGGTLAALRDNYNLGQGDLGEIDPASESMRLATLGLRGVASTILWQKAEEYKKEQSWDQLSATLNQIAVLQPHFIKVWEFQSHNLSYNVSSEFDNYRHRYQWVKRGIEYLVKGGKFNKHRTEIPYELGWFFGNKMGVADERKQFRELYRYDKNFHLEMEDSSGMDLTQTAGLGPDQRPDNWLSGRLWYERAYDMVAAGNRAARSEMMFYRMGPQWRMKYCEAIQGEGVLTSPAVQAWLAAGRDWKRFGERQIVTSFGDTIYLTELKKANREYNLARDKFAEFCGETYDRLVQEKLDALTPEELAIHQMEYTERDFQQVLVAEEVALRVQVRPMDVARAFQGPGQVEAMQMAKDLEMKQEKINHIEIYRNQINYAYWEQRCIAEQDPAAMAARSSMYEAEQLLEKAELDAAIEKFELAWENWEILFNKHPSMMIDDVADSVLDAIDRYRRIIDEKELPEDFGLSKFIEFREVYDDALADPGLMSVIAEWPQKYPGRNFLDEMLRKSKDLAKALEEGKGSEATIEIPDVTPVVEQAGTVDPATPAPNGTDEDGGTDKDDGENKPNNEAKVLPPDAGVAPSPSPPKKTEDAASKSPAVDADSTTSGQDGSVANPNALQVDKPAEGNAPNPVSGGNED